VSGPAEPAALSPGARLRAAAEALLIPPLLALASFQRVASMLERGWPKVDLGGGARVDAELAAFVDGVLHRLPGPWRHTCLKRAAVLFHLLRGAGRDVQLLIGVRRGADGGMEAHAWLTRAGEPYLEPNPEMPASHSVLARFPEGTGATPR
jgi:hypothetical protein